MALPYLSMPAAIQVQPHGVCVAAGLLAGALVTMRQGRRFGLAGRDLGLLVPCALAAAVFGGHFFDVLAYRWSAAQADPAVWFQMANGQALFGALFAIAGVTAIIARARGLHLAVVADAVTLGCVVALLFGRLGCALVHDHPGLPTDSVFGVDFPPGALRWSGLDVDPHATVRAHDLGLDELLLLLPLTAAAFALVRRRLNAGMVAAIVAIAYAVPRFGLDFLRLPVTDPTHAGLTVGQWCCLVTLGLAAFGLAHIATKARRSVLPTAVAR